MLSALPTGTRVRVTAAYRNTGENPWSNGFTPAPGMEGVIAESPLDTHRRGEPSWMGETYEVRFSGDNWDALERHEIEPLSEELRDG
jgi:hypothetical protein